MLDPKDGELCLNRVKQRNAGGARSDSDVQSIVEFGYRGERRIEPSSSCSCRSFPQIARKTRIRFIVEAND